jgi:hypothetical protein
MQQLVMNDQFLRCTEARLALAIARKRIEHLCELS